MSGLDDVTGGLNEGNTGLTFLTGGLGASGGLGGPTLGGNPPTSFLLLEDGSSIFLLEDGVSQLGLES
jgi:hypothetical protein